ncbi:MAG: hypothetical protein ACFE8E_07340 [Candidatus Hodarchaeota archaeon]
MTSLLEKALLTALGILILISLLSLVLPVWNQILNFNINYGEDYEVYSDVINELDQGITSINENPDSTYQKNINYPENLNISIKEFYIKYEYILGDQLSITIVEYQNQFLIANFKNLTPQIYTLQIRYQLNIIEIQIF